MTRKNQRLINFHTSSLTSMPQASDVHYGEIVVRHNEQQPELLIKVNESEFGVIPGSGAVASAISVAVKDVTNYIDGEVSTIEGSIADLREAVSGISTDIGENYVSNEALRQAQEELFNSATTVASEDATAKVDAAKDEAINAAAASAKTLNSGIEAVDGRVDTVSGNLNTFKTDVANTYETKANVTTAITAAKNTVYASATTAAAADATTKANAAKTDAINAAAASTKTLSDKIDGVDGKVDALSGNVHTTIENLESALTETINNKVATAYRFQGSCKYAELASKEKVNGYVWNVTDAHGNTPAGTNYAWSEDTQTWDALGGTIDLSPYALKTEVTAVTKTLQDNIDTANSRIDAVSGNLNTFKADVANTYETKNNVATAITAAKSAVYASATTAAAADAQTKANAAKTDAINAAAASAKTLSDTIAAVDDNLDALSGVTKTVKATADSAVQSATVNSGVEVTKNGTSLDFDFSELIIDCGDF